MPAGCSSSYELPNLANVAGARAAHVKPSVRVSCSNGQLIVTTNGMIGDTFTPITPNPLTAQSWSWKVPTDPTLASSATSLVNVMGAIGFTVTGLPTYGPEEGAQPAGQAYDDPVTNKILDRCGGHTGPAGECHCHEIITTSASLLNATVIGHAFDGFPIYSNPGNVYRSGYQRTGSPTTNAWSAYTYAGGGANTLDRCNGATVNGRYRYYVTSSFPYILGCHSGTAETQTGGGVPSRAAHSFSRANTLTDKVRHARANDCTQ